MWLLQDKTNLIQHLYEVFVDDKMGLMQSNSSRVEQKFFHLMCVPIFQNVYTF